MITESPKPGRADTLGRAMLWWTKILAGLGALVAAGWSQPGRTLVEDEIVLCGSDEIFILQSSGIASRSIQKTWSWRAEQRPELPGNLRDKFKSTDECKPVDGGAKFLITSSGGGVALVERKSGTALFYAVVANAHSAEILPGNRVVVAGSTHARGNCLTIFDLERSEVPIHSVNLNAAHGVVWDEQRRILWALGYDLLKGFALKNWESREPLLNQVAEYRLPDNGGHDLVPVPGSNDLVITTHAHVYLFDRESREFRLHPELGSFQSVKCVSIHPRTGRLLSIQAEGGNWWASRVWLRSPTAEILLPGERLYKARWISALPP